MHPQRSNPHVVMIGTSPSTQGGIASVVQSYGSAGLLERWRVRYLATHADGSSWRKVACVLRAAAALIVLPRPTFAHVHTASGSSFWRKLVFIALCRARGIPVLLHVHGGRFEAFHAGGGRVRQAFIRWALSGAEAVIALTPSWAQTFRAIAPEADVVVIPNPVDVPALEPAARRDDGSILFLGRLSFNKGLDVLLEAFTQVVRRHPGSVLLLGGLGDRPAVDAELRRLGIERNVHLLGWVDGAAKASLLSRAGIFTLPSRVEGLPVGMLEAMAYAVPVVVSRVGGVADALADGVEGIIVPPGEVQPLADALGALLDDRERARRMGAAGRARALAEFDSHVVAARVEQLYARVAAAHAPDSEPAA